ncbi:MAG: NAD-dependent epimerase/dehydratase family protein [Eubacterium sp.]|nr:NAD-dependent epimerase/dehydratase family protein [Eubacterium sp.]
MKHNKTILGLDHQNILVTGGAGFIGASLIIRLLKEMTSGQIINFDNINDYYDPKLKEYRLSLIDEAAKESSANYLFIKGNLADTNLLRGIFINYKPSIVVNLAAQESDEYAIDHPTSYIGPNIIGFFNIIEGARHSRNDHPGVQHLVYASSTSVYGDNREKTQGIPFDIDHPVSFYAATKKSNEVCAYSYSRLYGIPITGLRLSSVYGPAGRPDTLYYSAADNWSSKRSQAIINNGSCYRDFTYIDDAVEAIIKAMQYAPSNTDENGQPTVPYALYDIGKGTTDNLTDFISTLQEELVSAGILPSDFDFEAYKEYVEAQPNILVSEKTDAKYFAEDFGFTPSTTIREGLKKFAEWYKEYNA